MTLRTITFTSDSTTRLGLPLLLDKVFLTEIQWNGGWFDEPVRQPRPFLSKTRSPYSRRSPDPKPRIPRNEVIPRQEVGGDRPSAPLFGRKQPLLRGTFTMN